MKTLLITLVFIAVTASSVLAQTAKAPARKPPAAQTPTKLPTTQPKAKTPTSNARTALPSQSTPAKTPTNNATKPPAGKFDIIYRLDKITVEAFVIEIDDKTISYRKANNPGGPIYKVKVSEVDYIRYPNGTIERYNERVVSRPEPVYTPPKRQEPPQRQPLPRIDDSRESEAEIVPRRRTETASSGGEFFLTAGIGSGAFRFRPKSNAQNTDGVLTYRAGLGYMGPAFGLGRAGKLLSGSSLEYASMGGFIPFVDDDREVFNIKYKVNFVMLTAHVLYESPALAKSGKNKLNVFAGISPSTGYALGGTLSNGNQSADLSFTQQTGDGRFVRWHWGLGVQIGARYGRFSLLGHSNWTTNNPISLPTGSPLKIRMLTYGAGFRFHF